MNDQIAFVSKKNSLFHLIVDVEKAPELFAIHLIRTRTSVNDYKIFSSYSKKDICSRTTAMLKKYRKGSLFDSKSKLNGNLSLRQTEILPLVGRGLTNKEIASKVNLSVRGVKHHMTKIFKKLGMDNRMQLFVFMRGTVTKK